MLHFKSVREGWAGSNPGSVESFAHYEIGISSTWIVEHVRIGAELRLIYKIGKKTMH